MKDIKFAINIVKVKNSLDEIFAKAVFSFQLELP